MHLAGTARVKRGTCPCCDTKMAGKKDSTNNQFNQVSARLAEEAGTVDGAVELAREGRREESLPSQESATRR